MKGDNIALFYHSILENLMKLELFERVLSLMETNAQSRVQAELLTKTMNILAAAGIDLTDDALSAYSNLSTIQVQNARTLINDLPDVYGSIDRVINRAPKPISLLVADIHRMVQHKQPGGSNLKLVDVDTANDLIADPNNVDFITRVFPSFRPQWLGNSREDLKQTKKNQTPIQRVDAIRKAMMDISQGRTASVSAVQLEKWNNGAIGLTSRQIDNYLSQSPELADLGKYRAVGKVQKGLK